MTTNVVAEFGDPDAEHVVVVHAHHDAAHSGLVFDGGPPRALLRRFPKLLEALERHAADDVGRGGRARRSWRWARCWAGAGCAATGIGLSAGYVAAMADIGVRGVVPGANDNLSGVAVLLSLARSLREEPPPGTRVILLSAGSEESFMEGMQAFARRHFGDAGPRAAPRSSAWTRWARRGCWPWRARAWCG